MRYWFAGLIVALLGVPAFANDYYSATNLSPHTLARASAINSERAAVEAAFDKLPPPDAVREDRVTYLVDSGAADAYVVTMSPAPSGYAAGMRLVVKTSAINTGAATINVNSLGARAIKRTDGSALIAGDIIAGGIAELIYDGTSFILTSEHPGGASESYNPAAVAITGGTITSITDLAIADGGCGASTAAGCRSNLSVRNLIAIDTAGSSNAYTITSTDSLTPSDGDALLIVANHSNTGAATLDADGTGAKAIEKMASGVATALAADDLQAGHHYLLTYDAGETAWIVHTPSGVSTTVTDLADVTITGIASGELLKWSGSAWINNTLAEAGIAATSHSHAASDVTSGTFADALVAQTNVTQHQAALSITESQISDLQGYMLDLSDDLTPSLGGNLDVAGSSIISSAGGNIVLDPDTTGNVVLGNFSLDGDQTVGAGQDNYVLTYNNGTGLISLEVNPDVGLLNVVEDTTPQLGGNLDFQTYLATSFASTGIDDNAGSEVLNIDSSNRILIGTTVPDAVGQTNGSVTISNGDSGVTSINVLADQLVIENSGAAGMTIATPNTTTGYLMFADPDGTGRGQIRYNHSGDTLEFVAGATVEADITASGFRVGSGARITSIIDDDTMATASATTAATSESIKAYVDTSVAAVGLSPETVAATTSGATSEFTSLASGLNRITIILDGVGGTGTDDLELVLGDSGGYETTGYDASVSEHGSSGASATDAFPLVDANVSGADIRGIAVLARVTGNTWILSGSVGSDGENRQHSFSGTKTLSGTLDRLRIQWSGSDTFNAGQWNIIPE